MSTDRVADEVAGGESPLAALVTSLTAARAAAGGLEVWSVPTSELHTVLETSEGFVRAAQAAQVLVVGEVASRGDALAPNGLDPAARALLARSRAGDGRAELARALGVHPATAARRQATAADVTGAPAEPTARYDLTTGEAARPGTPSTPTPPSAPTCSAHVSGGDLDEPSPPPVFRGPDADGRGTEKTEDVGDVDRHSGAAPPSDLDAAPSSGAGGGDPPPGAA